MLKYCFAATVSEINHMLQVGDFGLSRSTDSGYYNNQHTMIAVRWTAPGTILQRY